MAKLQRPAVPAQVSNNNVKQLYTCTGHFLPTKVIDVRESEAAMHSGSAPTVAACQQKIEANCFMK